MTWIGAKGYNSFQEELDTEIQNTSNYINSVVIAEGVVDSGFTSRITDLEDDVGHQVSLTHPVASGLFLITDGISVLLGNPSAVQQLSVNGVYGVCSGLAEDLATLNTTMGEEQGFINTLQDEMTVVEGEVSTLKGEMTAVEGDIVILNDALGIVSAESFASSFSSTIQIGHI